MFLDDHVTSTCVILWAQFWVVESDWSEAHNPLDSRASIASFHLAMAAENLASAFWLVSALALLAAVWPAAHAERELVLELDEQFMDFNFLEISKTWHIFPQ